MSVPPEMKAAYINELGDANVIRYGELPVPSPGPTDVLVRVSASTVDPVDTFVRSGAYATSTPFPFVIGRDLVGTVVETGAGVSEVDAGRQVWCNSLGHGGRQGAWAEYAVVSSDRLYLVPDRVDPLDLVLAAHPAASAWLALHRHAGLRAADTVFVGGGAGNVGSAAVALAASAGARVVATAAAEDVSRVLSFGADEVVDYAADDVSARLTAAAPDGFDIFLDTSGQYRLGDAVELLAAGGRLMAMVGLHDEPVLPVGRLYSRDARIIGFAISNATVPDLAAAARGVGTLLRRTGWRPQRAGEDHISNAAEIHRRIAAGQIRGRLLILPERRHVAVHEPRTPYVREFERSGFRSGTSRQR